MKKFGTFRVLMLILLVLVLSIAPTIAFAVKKDDVTRERLFGETSKLQGVLTVWNVDTFEGGSTGKANFLESQARNFEKQHKGLYVLVENLTIEEFNLRKTGTLPDVISFGSGLYADVAPLVEDTATCGAEVLASVKASVTQNEIVKTTPWCLGGYFLLTSAEALSKCGKEEVDLVAERFSLGYSKTIGKTTRVVKSLTLGSSQFHNALDALKTLGEVNLEQVDELYATQTYYDAYVRFCGMNASILLGTQRDVARLSNKLSQGAISGLETSFIPYTDMVQYASVVKTDDSLRREYAQKFCQFLQSQDVQKALISRDLLPVCSVEVENKSIIADTALNYLKQLKVKNLY